MRPVRLDEIVPLEAYAALRPDYRQAMIAYKKTRRLAVGEKVTMLFEDRETLRFQVHEMLWIERIARRDKMQAELDVYNELVPREGELSATLFVEITEAERIREELDRMAGIDEHVWLVLGEGSDARRIQASFDPKQSEGDRISAVQYVRFALPREASAALADPAVPARVSIDHPSYTREAELRPQLREALLRTLAGEAPSLLGAPAAARERPGPELLFETPRVRVVRSPGVPVLWVEAREPGSLADAAPSLLEEVVRALQRAAATLLGEGHSCRVSCEVERSDAPMRWRVQASDARSP